MTNSTNEALRLYEKLVTDCQAILAEHVAAHPSNAEDTVNALLRLLDGPRYREARDATEIEGEGAYTKF